MRILVCGGAGFIGSHLVDRLVEEGHEVVVIDNFITGIRDNVHPKAELIHVDLCSYLDPPTIHRLKADRIYYLASPASPVDYHHHPINTWMANTVGLKRILDFAFSVKARVLFTSTSEIYGSPQVMPQPESYWGHVNSWGPRACYDESKRAGEALAYIYRTRQLVDVRVARIFNSYGPRLRKDDGRVVSNFIVQALTGRPLTVYGDGKQTRSFCYVTDTVDGLVRLMEVEEVPGPVNIGNPEEVTILELVETLEQVIDRKLKVEFRELPTDDPPRRRPDITLAKNLLGWQPTVSLREGLRRTVEWFARLGL